MTEKITIIGSEGLLGKELCKVFPLAIKLTKQNLDIRKPKDIEKILYELKPELVINTAAYTNVTESEKKENKKEINEVNGLGPGYIAKTCNYLNAKLVHISTDYVFDGEKITGYYEEDKTNPINAYGASKLLGEKTIIENMKNYYIIRTSALFGEGNNIVTKIIESVNQKKEIKAVINRRTKPTYAKDLAESIKQIITQKPGIYHSVNEGICTPYYLAIRIMELMNKETKLKLIKKYDNIQRPKNAILINTKTKHLRHWSHALKEYIDLMEKK